MKELITVGLAPELTKKCRPPCLGGEKAFNLDELFYLYILEYALLSRLWQGPENQAVIG